VRLYQFDNQGQLPVGLDTSLRMLGTTSSGCGVSCGSEGGTTTDIVYYNTSQPLNYYDLNTYAVRHWFNRNGTDFSNLTVSAVLDCNGPCSGTVKVRIGNASAYTDYDLVNASAVRTDGTTGNYSWYSNTYEISSSTLGNYFFVQLLIYTGSGTMRFMMDELGPTGPDSEYRTGSNGDGSQTGWFNDNGDYFIKVSLNSGSITAAGCLDLSGVLVGKLSKIPVDPSTGSDAKTYYAVKKEAGGQVTAQACGAEGEEIKISK